MFLCLYCMQIRNERNFFFFFFFLNISISNRDALCSMVNVAKEFQERKTDDDDDELMSLCFFLFRL